jgi:hypothetical protein
MQTALVLRGKMKDERTIELDEPVGNVEAEVEVIVRPVGPPKPAPLRETLPPEKWKKMFRAWIDSRDPEMCTKRSRVPPNQSRRLRRLPDRVLQTRRIEAALIARERHAGF